MPKKVPKKRGRPGISIHTRLTRMQQLFVRELVANDGHITLREAAINAGYAPTSAHTRAYELTNPDVSPHVVAEIRRYRAELDAKGTAPVILRTQNVQWRDASVCVPDTLK